MPRDVKWGTGWLLDAWGMRAAKGEYVQDRKVGNALPVAAQRVGFRYMHGH